jgi:class 3 adenylate cyclase/streptogramin lyase
MPGRRIATVLMLDVVGSTHIAAELGDARYRALSTGFNRIVRESLRRFGGKEEDHAGDGFFATFPQPDRAIRSAVAISDAVRELGIEIRAGIHTGQTEDQGGKAQGIAVVIGARVMSLAGEGELLVTSTTKELVTGSGFGFEDLSAHELKGVPGTWQVFAVTSLDDQPRARALPAAEAAERRGAIVPITDRKRPPRALAWAAVGAALLAAIVVVALIAMDDDPTRPVPPGDAAPAQESVVELDPETGEILVEIPAPVDQRGRPGFQRGTPDHVMALGQGGVWILRSYRWLYHVDPREDELRSVITLDLGGGPSFSLNLAVGLDEIWIAHDRGLSRVDPATEGQRIVVPNQAATSGALGVADVTLGAGHIWLLTPDGRLVRFDPRTGRSQAVRLPGSGDVIAFGYGSLWIGDTVAATVTRYDPETLRPDPAIQVPQGVDNIVIGDRLWVLSQSADVLTPVDPGSGDPGTSVPLGEDPTGLTAGDGAVWVGDEDGVIRRVDENTRQVTEIPFGSEIRALAYDDDTDTLWVDVAGPL